jgi:transcriptional repressor NrdR
VRCPFCSQLDSKVIDSRVSTAGDVIRRRRECEGCQRRFTSRERVEDVLPVVVKKDGVRQPFDREKVLAGVRLACNKRPVAMDRIERFIDELERELIEGEAKEVPSKEIGERVMKLLRELDEVAFVRFASVYRSFRDIEEFRSELDKMALGREAREAARDEAGEGARDAGPAPAVVPVAAASPDTQAQARTRTRTRTPEETP